MFITRIMGQGVLHLQVDESAIDKRALPREGIVFHLWHRSHFFLSFFVVFMFILFHMI
jgi:hypothetical protein